MRGLDWRLALRLALRDLRGGLAGFRILILCLALGVGAIAAVGMLRSAIEGGLSDQGAIILGGDAQMNFTYRFASDPEKAWMAAHARKVSEVVEFRSMAVTADDRTLTQVKAVDDAWPLLGVAGLDQGTVAAALGIQNGLPGALMERVLADRLGLKVGDTFKLGLQSFRLGAILTKEPDSATAGLGFGPRTVVRTADLAQSGLIGPGTLFETDYRLILPPGADLDAMKAEAETAFGDKGMRWSDRRHAAVGVEKFVERLGSFLILVGLAGLAVGGVGVASAVRAFMETRMATIATLKVLGAEGRLVMGIYLVQVGLIAGLGVAIGLALGAAVPVLAGSLIASLLPFPAQFGLYPAPLLQAAFYGLVTGMLFALWPLSQAVRQGAASLYRGAAARVWPRLAHLGAMAGLLGLFVGGAVWFSGSAMLALGTLGGVFAALAVLALAGFGLRVLARWLARRRFVDGRPGVRLALAAIGGPRSEALAVVLSLGLGLSVLAVVGQIDANFRASIARDLPSRAPSFFFIDIQDAELQPFLAGLKANPAVSKVENAPMLRGLMTKINGRKARDVVGDHWVVTGDRGITFADTPPPGTQITAGAWWPKDYTGPAQVSFAATEAAEMHLKLGDKLTLNILGRDIDATITSFRKVDFSGAGMGFVMALDPAAVAGAPHTSIATVYATPEAEAAILRDTSKAYPNVTAISVKEAIARAVEALGTIATATVLAAGAVLVTGVVVLIGGAAAGVRARMQEAAVLKVLGATRLRILASFALRSALTGAAAGLVAILAGGIGGWAVLRLVMDLPYRFEPVSAGLIVLGGMGATLLAGLIFALLPISVRPAQVLRGSE
ncbi:FtsX-like permease family protein [bacterium]|nr:FtsX-like permease family protein [bacterium]